VPATQVLPLVLPLLLPPELLPPELLPPELDPPLLLPPELDPPELEPPELDVDSPQKNDLFALPHATSPSAQAPSMHAAARYESPLSQPQHVGLQSAYVEHDAPLDFVPFNFCGLDGHPPFTCSACDETFVEDDDDPDEDDDEEEPEGFVPSVLPPTSVPLAPEQATRRKSEDETSEDEAMRQPNFMRAASATCVPQAGPRDFRGLARRRVTLAQALAPGVALGVAPNDVNND
jgi:hypothetical protein